MKKRIRFVPMKSKEYEAYPNGTEVIHNGGRYLVAASSYSDGDVYLAIEPLGRYQCFLTVKQTEVKPLEISARKVIMEV